jgi:hypothetical protein
MYSHATSVLPAYFVAMAPSILLSVGFFLLAHQAGALSERSPGKLED